MGLNSSPDEDQIGALATSVYETLVAHQVVGATPAGAAA